MRAFQLSLLIIFLIACTGKKDEKTTSGSTLVADAAGSDSRIIEEQSEPDTLKGSLKAKATGTIGEASININYYSPAVRGRIIWGGLVPFDKVWVTGAHSATNVEFSDDVLIGEVKIGPGKYALFTIPGKEEWTIIINKNWEQHLTDNYDQREDLVRVKVKSETAKMNQERLRFVIESGGDSKGEIVVYWEKLKISLPIAADTK